MPDNPNPARDEKLRRIIQDSVRELALDVRDHFAATAKADPVQEARVDRLLGSAAAAGAVALTVRGKNDALAATLFVVAVRLWSTTPREQPEL